MKASSIFASLGYNKAFQVGLWSVWLSGFLLIGLSLYATQRLPSLKNQIKKPILHHREWGRPNITIFSAPRPFNGSIGASQVLAVRSWLALSPDVSVVLFGRDPSVLSLAGALGSRVSVEPNIDFTFLGTPFFHSMVARSWSSTSDISVLVDPTTILLVDFISTLNYAHKLDHDWLLVASASNASYFPFHLDKAGKHWLREGGERIKIQELQEFLAQKWLWSHCELRMLMAWNTRELPLHAGVLPPFLFGKGLHNHWVINEALSSDFRFVFDASQTISSFFQDYPNHRPNQLSRGSGVADIIERSWEYMGNSYLGTLYGSLYFHGANFSNNIVKLVKCDGRYLFINTAESIAYPFGDHKPLSLWKGRMLRSRKEKKLMECVDDSKSLDRNMDCSVQDLFKSSTPLSLPFSLKSLLSVLADKDKTIVLAVAGNSYRDMLMSWVCRLRHLLISNFLVCALDHEVYKFSILQGLPVFIDPLAPSNISFNECHFGTKCFQRVTKVKSRLVLQILKLGYNVLLSDVDVYWFKNPLPLLRSFGPAVLVAQSDEYTKTGPINLPRRLNSGFYFARSDGVTIAAIEKVVNHAATSVLSEQPSFYDVLCGEGGSNRIGDDKCLEPETNLTIHFLDRNLFPNGAYHSLWEKENVKAACVKKGCLILHNNWISGRKKKLERQVSKGLWDYEVCLFILGGSICQDRIQKKELEGASISLDLSLKPKDLTVRIVHAGGLVDLYRDAIPASQVMGKYPGMCLALPEVFKQPHESLVRPEEMLFPGQKFYLVPYTTVRKLKGKHLEKVRAKEPAESEAEEVPGAKKMVDVGGYDSEESVCSAKDFFVSRERWSKCVLRGCGGEMKKPFTPPIKKARMWQGSEWQPSLTSVEELSP